MYSNSKLRSAVRLGLSMGASTLAVGFAPGALAQSADQADEVIEEIITTGSRIKRADLDSASPITVISRDAILATGIVDVGNLIKRIPSMTGSPIGTTTNNGGNGEVNIDLRGMGVDRTLTLINGKRVVDGGDYQAIPAVMIERVEILKDGASAVYGADAVSGVVNIITRRDFEGIEISAQTADYFDMDDGAQRSISLIAGTTFDGGNFVFGAEYVDQSQAFQGDAPWDFFATAYYIYPEGCENQLTAPYDGTATGGCYPLGSSRIPESRLGFMNQGTFLIDSPDTATTPYEVGLMSLHDGRTYNYSPVNYIQTPYERTNLFAEAHFEVTENVRFNTEIRGTFRQSAQELAPQPYDSRLDPAFSGTFGGAAYNGISEDNYYLRRAVDAYNATGPVTPLVYEPVVDARRRMIETNRRFTQDIAQYQFMIGLEGTFNDMDWDVYYDAGYRNRVNDSKGQFSGARLSNAMGPSADLDGDGIPECYTDIADPVTLIEGCVPLNFFGGGVVDPISSKPVTTTLTQDMIDYVTVAVVETYVTTQETLGATITGSAFDLPGGELGWAAGYAYWGQSFTYEPDSGLQTDAVTGNTGAGTAGSLYNNSVFLEFLAPVFDNGVQSIDIKGGLRYDDWNAFDGDTTWQFGIEVRALDTLKLRATAGTVFRAPTIEDLFGGIVDDFPTYSDPCTRTPLPPGCAQVGVQTDSQVLARVGGNSNLIPETGDTLTAGFVWTPEFGDSDLSLTVDYWQIDLEDGISSLGVQFILEDCYVNQNATSCALITRRPNYSVDNILDGSLNVAEQGAQGIDTEIRYSFDTGIGQWEAALLWSHLLERTKIASPGDVEQDLSGRYTDWTAEDGGAYATDKFNVSLQWSRDNLSIGYLGEFISELDADTFCNCFAGNQPDGTYIQAIDSQMYHDLYGRYDFQSTGTTISVGITNITDEPPPYIEIGFNATTDQATYRQFGIGYYLRLTQSFK